MNKILDINQYFIKLLWICVLNILQINSPLLDRTLNIGTNIYLEEGSYFILHHKNL